MSFEHSTAPDISSDSAKLSAISRRQMRCCVTPIAIEPAPGANVRTRSTEGSCVRCIRSYLDMYVRHMR